MKLRGFLLLMTGIAVVSDSLLHPFYPQYLARVFGVTDPTQVGRYIATCSLTVLTAFPLWALVARRVHVLALLVATQLAAGAFSLACAVTQSLFTFWLLSVGMMLCKASYLLIYPYVMSHEDKERHIGTIGLLAFVVYFGNILAALLSGVIFELLEPRWLFSIMALADGFQVLLCLYWLRGEPSRPQATATLASLQSAQALPPLLLLKLGAVMFVLYFSAYLSEPFFAAYWESLIASHNRILSGVVFAIPGLAALSALWVNGHTRFGRAGAFAGIVPAIALGIVGLLLQASGSMWLVVAGRFLYGWALFQAMVRLDRLLFRASTPETYATDFSKANLFQGLGVLVAGSSAGSLVLSFGTRIPLLVAAAGFGLGAALFITLFRGELRADELPQTQPVNEGSALT
jgi:MFS transporter, DHA1 family, multidrug resistance protein